MNDRQRGHLLIFSTIYPQMRITNLTELFEDFGLDYSDDKGCDIRIWESDDGDTYILVHLNHKASTAQVQEYRLDVHNWGDDGCSWWNYVIACSWGDG